MSLPYGLLGLLSYNDSSGYELTKLFEDSLNNFWHAQGSQIYRELNRLENKGWVSSHTVVQENRPNKRVYSITDSGRSELDAWLRSSQIEQENPHIGVLLKVFFGADAPSETLELLRQCRDQCSQMLEGDNTRIRKNIASYADFIPNGESRSLYWNMTLELGIATTKAMLEWAEACIAQIESQLDEGQE